MKRFAATACAAALLGFAPLPASASDAIEIEITDIDPVHTPGEPLSVEVTVTNPGPAREAVSLDLTAQTTVPLYRSSVTSWISDDTVTSSMLTLDRRSIDLPTGRTTIDIDVPREVLTWGNTSVSWGPRGVQAALSFDEATIVDRTFLTTEPSFDQEPMSFTALVPLTIANDELVQVPTTSERYGQSIEALSAGDLGPDEVLPDPVTSAVRDAAGRVTADIDDLTSPGITLALDSAFAALDTVDLTQESLSAFTDGDGHELIMLPALDADLSAWAGTGEDLFFLSHVAQAEQSRQVLSGRNIPARSDVLYTPGSVTASVAELGIAHGSNLLVVPRSDVPAVEEPNWTPSAHALLDDVGTEAVLVDDELSALLAGESELTELDRRQTLLALTAVHYRERPNDHRPLVLSLPRGDDLAVTVSDVNAMLDVLDDTSWLAGVTLSDIEELPFDPFAREDLSSGRSDTSALTPALIDSLTTAGDAIVAIGDLTSHPLLFEDAASTTYRIAGSWSWTAGPGELSNRVGSVQALSGSLTSALKVQSSSTINLISQASEFPVHITSTLPLPIEVEVDVVSEDRRLQFEVVTTTLQPNTTTTIGIPVKAVGSGNVRTQVDIVGPDGSVLGTGAEIDIRVRADWENVGTAILAGLVLLVLIIGVIRSARRGTRTQPLSETDIQELED
ncbi:DUF6049 family protein [Flaviflexus equikiangi]|uniref:Uncharacterized protein n=1 Tax=Flaviflexus equikiangi TaxID=2758573 RepID=A0ABS2TEI7_9ACTO|nr:DUF6049 family protein [Flaviflexus equikiangi]MBM9432167.1 hypothetical protein [Flaviflexus equikiangi]